MNIIQEVFFLDKDLNYYLKFAYPINIRHDTDDGGFIFEFPDLRYCVGTPPMTTSLT